MARKLSKKQTTAVWSKFPEDPQVELLIQPFSLFNLNRFPNQKPDYELTTDEVWGMFKYCLKDWKGLTGEDDNPLKYNEENLALIFDFDQDIVAYVIDRGRELREKILTKKSAKNLSTSQPGETQKIEK